jgi:amino acid transporter
MSTPTGAADAAPRTKAFGLFSMILFSVSAILVADTVGSSAAMGVQGLTFWVALAILFFIPYGFVTAELGAAWPDEGGIYVWVKEAFGPMWGSVTAWLYWVNVALWAPSVFVLLTGTIRSVYWESMSTNTEMVLVLILIWVMVAIGVLPLWLSKWIPSLSAVLKVVVLVILGIGGVAYMMQNGAANSFALSEFKPTFSSDSLAFLPVVIYSYMGFELMSSAGDAIRDPKRDVPKMIGLAGGAILFMYLFSTFGILASIPQQDINIVSGIADALKLAFDTALSSIGWMYDIVIICLAFTFLGNMVTWSLGANHSIAATGLDKSAPGVFGHTHRRFESPDYAFYLMGAIASVVTVINFQLFSDNESIFWTIFALSSVVFLLPYLLMFPALVVLRRKFPDQPRPYRVPLGNGGAWLWTLLCEAGIVMNLFLFFWAVPEGTNTTIYWAITGGGTLLSIAVGFMLYQHANRKTPGGRHGPRPATHAAGPV